MNRKIKFIKKALLALLYISFTSPTNISHANQNICESWETNISSLPSLLDYFSAVKYKDCIYYIGGYDRTLNEMKGTVQIYNTKTNSWSYGADMPTPRGYTKSIEYNGKIYCFGGTDSGINSTSGNTLDTFEIYDIESNTWSSGGRMPEPKEKMGIELYEDKILIIGGIKDRTTISYSTNISVFNLKTNKWEESIPTTIEKAGFTTQLYNDNLYIFGGNYSHMDGTSIDSKEVLIYNLKTKTWSNGSELSVVRHGTASIRYGLNIYIFGGRGDYKNRYEIEVYDIESNTLKDMETSSVELHWGSVILKDGIIYCMLGEKTNGVLSKCILKSLSKGSSNSDIYIRPLNTLTLSLNTNMVTFEDVDLIDEFEIPNAIEISIESSLPYQLNATLVTEIKNNDGTKVLDPNILSIKTNSDSDYKTFSRVGESILLCSKSSGTLDKIWLDIRLNKGFNYKTDYYKCSMKIEANQI